MPIILAFVLITGILIGSRINKNFKGYFITSSSGIKLESLLKYINEEYVDPVSTDSLIESVIPSMLKYLDPHSVYIPASDFKASNESLEGNFEGIGVQFNVQNDTIFIINTITGGPSEKAGLKAGDRIIKVNDTLVAGIKITSDDVMKKLKGQRGTKVEVSVMRNDNPGLTDFIITRDKIPLISVDVSYMVSKDIGYIKISKFSRTTRDEFINAIKKLHNQNGKKLIIDLRGNGGGYMDVATKIADEILDGGKIIVYTEGKARPKSIIESKPGGLCLNDSIVILIDEWSASASEIIAGAIQDNDRGTIIGRRSYGKGLVQEQSEFADGSALRLTVARYYTPTGRCIQKPYNHGMADYYADLNKRFLHGEFEQKDSIHFPDSLKFVTPGGKTVYGGGGIMPDIFVPADTTGLTPFYNKVSNKGLIYQFAFSYTDKYRNILLKSGNYKELKNYLDKQDILGQFLSFASKKGERPGKNDILLSANIITVQIKALISRNIFNDDGFYPVLREIDNTITTAVKVLDEN